MTKTVNNLISDILTSSGSTDNKIKLIEEIRKIRPPLNDRVIYRTVVGSLSFISIITVFGAMYPWLVQNTSITGAKELAELPNGIVAIGSAALGALAGLISPTGNNEKPEETIIIPAQPMNNEGAEGDQMEDASLSGAQANNPKSQS